MKNIKIIMSENSKRTRVEADGKYPWWRVRRWSSGLTAGKNAKRDLHGLVVGTMGVVFGDIGTSPLYTIKEAFTGDHAVSV